MIVSLSSFFQRFYIAAQGPLPNTVVHFWQMILQCDVHIIVMLTDVSESSAASGSTKGSSCMPYWPGKDGSTLELGGGFTVLKKFSTASHEEEGGYVTSTLVMTHKPSKTQRTIWHLQVCLLFIMATVYRTN